eukprot:SAG31_NODE_3073_length_4714_cov_2.744529_4_plen_273_part_00
MHQQRAPPPLQPLPQQSQQDEGVAVLHAHLLANSSTRSAAVAEIEHASVPHETRWFFLKPTVPPTKPDGLLHGLWRARTQPKPTGQLPQGVQQISFDAACEFAAGCDTSRHNYSYTVEAWSDRNDLGGPGTPTLLARSAPLNFHYDDRGFKNLRFVNFSAVEHGPGHVTISCVPNSAELYSMAEQITWFGYDVETTPPSGLPTFRINQAQIDSVYSARLVSPPSISLTFSDPGTYFVGIYGEAPFSGFSTLFFVLVYASRQGAGKEAEIITL